MQMFELHREEDVSGVSGVGVVAEGVQFHDGTVVIRWFGDDASTVVWPDIASAEKVHGHGGRTRIVWNGPAGTIADRERAR
jgi:hypothetical protein